MSNTPDDPANNGLPEPAHWVPMPPTPAPKAVDRSLEQDALRYAKMRVIGLKMRATWGSYMLRGAALDKYLDEASVNTKELP